MKGCYLLLLFLAPLFYAQSQTLLTENFEDAVFSPAAWTLINGNAPAGRNWARNTDANLEYVKLKKTSYPAFQGSGSMVYEFSSDVSANAWAITPSVSLASGTSYTITFYYQVFKSLFPEKLKVTVGNAATAEAQSTVLWDNNGGANLTNDFAWTKATVHYTPSSAGNFYFGFNCYSDADMFSLMVDNIKIEATPTAVPACAALTAPGNGAANISAPQALFTWNSASAAEEYVFKLGTTTSPDSIGTSTGMAAYQSGLAYNTTYYWTVVPKNAVGSAAGCPVYSFTTQPTPPVPVNDECAGAISLAANESVQGSAKSATRSMPAEVCNGNTGDANDDVWFKFTPLLSGNAAVTLTPDLIFDGVINAYSGTCGSLVSLACADEGVDGENEVLSLQNVIAGETYYFRVYGFGNTGKDGSFTLAVSMGTTLPVNITTFKGKYYGEQNALSWVTLTEQNNKGFELQRSANGRDFTTLAFISSKASNGNSSSALTYNYTDVKPLTGKNYYRLRQADIDGRTIISNTVLLKGSQTNSLSFSNVYPNPAKSFVNIVLTVPAAAKVNVTITDLAGKPVMQQAAQLTTGENNLSLNVNTLPSGSYMIRAISAHSSQIAVSKFVKQ